MYEQETEMVRNEIERRIQMRLRDNRVAFARLNLQRFYIAGGALHPEEPNDYDLFPVKENDFNHFFTYKRGEKASDISAKVWETPNAITYEINGIKIQLCKFWKPNLVETVERFDFTHCKIGVEVQRYNNGQRPFFMVINSYISPDYIRYRMLGYSEYNPKADCYPLSSLLRVWKYIKKGFIRSSYDVVFKILEAFLERSYKSRDDFLQQLKGIDIGIDEARMLSENAHILKHIYYLLTGDVIPQDDIVESLIREVDLINVFRR